MPIVSPLNIDKFIDNLQLEEVKSPGILASKGKYDVDGLFSETIFGLNYSNDRKSKYAYINLNTKLLHPFIYDIFKKIEAKVIKLIDGETYYYDELKQELVKDKSENLKEVSGYDGAMYAIEHRIKFRGDTDIRERIIKRLNEVIENRLAFIEKMIVIPPDYRPAQMAPDGSLLGVDDVNSLYIKLINLSKKIKMIDNNDKAGVMSDSASIRTQMQNIINDLYLYGKLKTGKKTGVGRSSLLGKRVDFSGRSVITGGYDIPVGSMGVPYRMLANISEPFLIHYYSKVLSKDSPGYDKFMSILKKNNFDTSLNVMIVTNFLRDLSDDKIKLDKEDEDFIVESFQEILNDKMVVAKRDPSLHKASWQSFKIVVERGVAMRLNVTQPSLFNADFDGDSYKGKVKIRYK